MKLSSTLLLFAAAGSSFAQTAKPAVRRTVAPKSASQSAAKSTGCTADSALPVMPIAVPKVDGCSKPLYALRYVDTLVGTGAPVAPRKWLTVNYTGYLLDGTKFDTSVGKDPITFPYGAHQVITGWDTGFEGMNIGGKRRLYIPYELAYGEAGRPPVIPAKAELVFDLELVAISDTPPAPKTPPAPPTPPTPPAGTTKPATDSGAAPSGAQTTVGKPVPAPVPDAAKPSAPTDPTKPAAVPPAPKK